ncbi:hypothetical protein VB711_13065, partial [Cronbergia sp. UHCC 0137]|nr:hypothetical protein [Cronbergia sp. UHCC 0137]
MLPTLDSFGLKSPVYIRKIDKARHWNPEDCASQEERAERAAKDIFSNGINSLYLVKSNDDFYAMVAAISARRNPKQQDIHFIWMTDEELKEVGIEVEAVVEGDCLQAKYL